MLADTRPNVFARTKFVFNDSLQLMFSGLLPTITCICELFLSIDPTPALLKEGVIREVKSLLFPRVFGI